MMIACPQCGTRYNLSAAQIGPEGRMLKCAKCQHQWFVPPEEPAPAADPDQPPPLPPVNSIGLDELAYVGANPAWWRRFGRSLTIWLALAVVMLGSALAVTLYVLLHPAETTHEALGPAPLEDPQPDGLVLSDLTRDIQEDGLLVVLRFSGTITNTGHEPRRVPELRLQLLDAKGIELDFWPAEIAKPVLEAGESTRWTARFLNPALERIATWRAFFKADRTSAALVPAPIATSPSAPKPSSTDITTQPVTTTPTTTAH